MSDNELEYEPGNNAGSLVEAIRWQNINRIAKELEIAAAEVGSSAWVTQAQILQHRVNLELELLNIAEWE